MFVAVSLNTDPGKIIDDTKLDLVIRPMAFLERSLHLWDPSGSAGQLQNQAYGYLFPMGPFFGAGQAIGLQPWAVQRLWWGLLLSVSYVGFLLLTRRLLIGSEWTRLVGGVAFALAPHVLTILGRSSVEAWPSALAPWVLLPLVALGAEGRPRRAAMLSGLAVLAMGGVNAAVNLAAVLPAVIWLLTRSWSRAWLQLVLWWGLAVSLATMWWVLPLLTLGRYSPPFLDFIESASFTTSTTSLVETVRGTADWVAYLGVDSSRTGFALLTEPLLIVFTVLLVILGLVGLTLRRTPERWWLVLTLMAGVVLVTMGHIGPVDGFFAADVRAMLDGALAPLRNVHKFDILIRLSLSVGLVAALASLSHGRTAAESRFLGRVVAAAGAFVVVGASAPFFGLNGAPAGSFEEVPSYWTQATEWLGARDATGRTLLLPGSRFAQYDWGRAGDEPMQALANTPWDVRNAVPLSSAGHIRWLDGIERRVADGRGGDELAQALADGGVRYVLVRNDLAYGPAQATRPLVVRSALAATDGVTLEASFGPLVGGGDQPTFVADQRLRLPMRAIDVYRVEGPAEPRAQLVAAGDLPRVTGAAEVATDSSGSGQAWLVAPGSPGADRVQPADSGGRTMLTDTPRRREANFGIGTFGASQTLSPTDPLRIVKPARDYGAEPQGEAVARYLGVQSLTASSSASDADAYPHADPGSLPYSAFDGVASTGWRPNPIKDTTGSWLDVDFGRAVQLGGGTIELGTNTPVRRVGLVTDNGRTSLPIVDGTAELPAVSTNHLRISLEEIEGDRSAALKAVVRDVAIPGVVVRRAVVLPPMTGDAAPDLVSVQADTGRGACLGLGGRPLCAPALTRIGEDAAGLIRTFSSARSFSATVRAQAVPRVGSAALEERVARALNLPVEATASSRAVSDLGGAPFGAIDGDLGTAWVAEPGDTDPSLGLRWDSKRRLTSISVLLDQYVAGTRPTSVRITSPDGERTVPLDDTGHGTFAALRTNRVTLHFAADELVSTVDPYSLETSSLGVGASEVVLGSVTVGVRPSDDHSSDAVPVIIGCGDAPVLRVGDQTVPTRVSTTVGALRTGTPVDATPCEGSAVEVAAGETTVLQPDPASSELLVSDAVLTRLGIDVGRDGAASGGATVREWTPNQRTVALAQRSGDTVLVVRENANDGWRATIDGRQLRRTTVNGWQQGYVVPAGGPTTVALEFTPDARYRSGLLAGALAALALLVLTVLPDHPAPNRRVVPVAPGRRNRAISAALVFSALGAIGGWAGLAVGAVVLGLAWGGRRFATRGGRLLPRSELLMPVTAAVAFALAGLNLVLGEFGTSSYAADDTITQVLVLVSLAVVGLSLALPPAAADGPGRALSSRQAPPVDGEPIGSPVSRGT